MQNRAKGFAICVAGRSHCACGTRERFAFVVLLLVARQEATKKRAKTFPLGTPLAARCFTTNGRNFGFCKSPPSAGHISHPADGFAFGNGFCDPAGVGGRSKSAERIYAERPGFPKTSIASFGVRREARRAPSTTRLCGNLRSSREGKPLPTDRSYINP